MSVQRKGVEMQHRIIAIDPGAQGGVAWTDREGIVHAISMPDGMTAQADLIREIWARERITKAVMEKVGQHVAGNNASASCKFARHCGHLEAILYMLSIPVIQVAPQSWMKQFGALPKDKTKRKNALKEEAARRYPHLRVTLATADALCLLEWGLKRG